MNIQPFAFAGQQVRIESTPDGQAWFVASDVAKVLGYSATAAMTRRLDDDDKGVRDLHTPGGDQQMTVITEPGLYTAVLGSQVEGAKAFKRWVTHEVLPSIRKTGAYVTPTAQPVLPDLADGASPEVLDLIQRLAAGALTAAESAQKNQRKADAFDSWLNGKGCYSVGTVARMIGIGQQRLFDFLYAEKILISQGRRRREPFSRPELRGWFEVRVYDQANTNGHASTHTGVTPYGAEQIRLLAVKRGLIEPQLMALTGGA